MSVNHEEKVYIGIAIAYALDILVLGFQVRQLVETAKGYGKPMGLLLRVITWEPPLSLATIFAACSILYVILYNFSIKTFSVLGLLALWLDYHCRHNNIEIPDLTVTESERLHPIFSRLLTIQTKITQTFNELKAAQDQNVFNFHRQICTLFTLAILASWFIDNLLLCYLIGTTALLMVGMSCSVSDLE